jgi:hypothetical protein
MFTGIAYSVFDFAVSTSEAADLGYCQEELF